MAWYNNTTSIGVTANGAIAPARFCRWDSGGGADRNVLVADDTSHIAGVSPEGTFDADTTNAADSGDSFQMYVSGIVKIESGAAVSMGSRVISDGTGRCIDSPGVSEQEYGGTALTATASAGEMCMVLLRPGAAVAAS